MKQKQIVSAALLGSLVLAWSPPAEASNTWGLQIYFEPLNPADTGDTAMFFDCTLAQCQAHDYQHIPPYDIDAGSHYPGLYWVFMTVPNDTWDVWAGCQPPYPCAPGGSSLNGSWAVITENGINLGPTIVGDKATWRQWAAKAGGVSAAASVAAAACRASGNTVCSAAAGGVAAAAGAVLRRFTQAYQDPYDADYQIVPDGAPWTDLPYSGNACGDNALTALGRIGGLLDGLVAAADRYPSALVNQDQASADQQAAAVANFSARLHSILDPAQTQLPGVFACGPHLRNVDTSQFTNDADYYAFEALFGPREQRNSAWQQLDAATQQ